MSRSALEARKGLLPSSEGSWEVSRQCWAVPDPTEQLPTSAKLVARLPSQKEFQSCLWTSAHSPEDLPRHCLPQAVGKGPGATDRPGKGRTGGREARVGAGSWEGVMNGKGTCGDLRREGTQIFSSSSFFEVSLWFEFNFDFLNFSRLELK